MTDLSDDTAEQALADPAEEVRAAAGHCARRARALIGQGPAEAAAIEQAADEGDPVRPPHRPARPPGPRPGGPGRRLPRQHLPATATRVTTCASASPTSTTPPSTRTSSGPCPTSSGRQSAAGSPRDVDEHVGDHGSVRTDWIETVLAKAAVPGGGLLDRYRAPCSAPAAAARAGSCPSS